MKGFLSLDSLLTQRFPGIICTKYWKSSVFWDAWNSLFLQPWVIVGPLRYTRILWNLYVRFFWFFSWLKIYILQKFMQPSLFRKFPIFGQKWTLTKFPIYEHSFLLVMAQNFLDDSVCRIFQTWKVQQIIKPWISLFVCDQKFC